MKRWLVDPPSGSDSQPATFGSLEAAEFYAKTCPTDTRIIDRGHGVETDPTGRSFSDVGSKMDAGKAPMWRGLFNYFPRALKLVADVSAAGLAKGYSWGGWKSVPDGRERYTDAMLRHLAAEGRGEIFDNVVVGGTGCPHDAMVAWNALARLELRLVKEERAAEERTA